MSLCRADDDEQLDFDDDHVEQHQQHDVVHGSDVVHHGHHRDDGVDHDVLVYDDVVAARVNGGIR